MASAKFASTYVKATGDVGGATSAPDGSQTSKCWYDKWWFSPSCRNGSANDCIPLISAGDGWGLGFSTQQATVHFMPVAIAVGLDVMDSVNISINSSVVFYWWVTDGTLQCISPVQVESPVHYPWE
eukprot:TRINITY_DN19858_c0_g1_i1.p1 TRINITY_DN19858_c0_g1~~TRINITY_DN19858_c0_g1_i1.p1  ORF type:complete len:126 (-),score=16.03 TRINITY_DN19858_c0_g1_i1:1247-1624(-)